MENAIRNNKLIKNDPPHGDVFSRYLVIFPAILSARFCQRGSQFLRVSGVNAESRRLNFQIIVRVVGLCWLCTPEQDRQRVSQSLVKLLQFRDSKYPRRRARGNTVRELNAPPHFSPLPADLTLRPPTPPHPPSPCPLESAVGYHGHRP